MPKDEVMKNGRWEFDEEVTDVFDDMLERCIPQYDVMRNAVHNLMMRHVSDGSVVVDLGCSRGGAIARAAAEAGQIGYDASFVGVEISEPMRMACLDRFAGMANVQIADMDLRKEYPPFAADVTLSVLCAMFVPIEHRMRLFHQVHEHTKTGGAFILVEKVLGSDAVIDQRMVSEYLEHKRNNGYTDEQIARKRLNLEGVLVPVTAGMNETFLRAAGFQRIDCFWRWMNFAGWVALKG